MRIRNVLLLAGTLASGLGFSQSNPKAAKSHKSKKEKKSSAHVGTASFYANKFNGRRMANGDIFYQHNMTGACNIVSLNTFVRVTNLRNKRIVVVKVTDRMHRENPRLIDLSRAAASQLGYTGHGLTKVKMEVLGKEKPKGWKYTAGP
jgi:peptidoglycan lytic transglycosylase